MGDLGKVRRLAEQTVHAIFDDLADRRGVPRELAAGSDWQEARRRAVEIVMGALLEAADDAH